MKPSTESSSDRAELLLRTSRRALMIVLAGVLLAAATVIAHVVRPGSLLADWASKAPWLLPVAIVFFFILHAPLAGRNRADALELRAMLADEFRQANLLRAQRLALIVVAVAQVPLAILASGLAATAAVTVMAVSSVTLAMATVITSFLYFDRE